MCAKISFFYDKTLKFIASNNLTSFFLFFGIKCLPLFPIQNEIIDPKLDKILLDFPVLTLGGIVNLEFQLNTTAADENRFLKYILRLYEKYDNHIYLVVLDFNLKEDLKRIIRINYQDRLTIYYKSLIQRNPDKVLNIIIHKLENRTRLFGKDIVGFEVLPLLDLDRKIELLKKACDAFSLLGKDVLSLDKIEEIRLVLMNYAFQWDEDELLMKLGDVSEMNEINDEFARDAIIHYGELKKEEGREEGREEVKIEIANGLIKDGFSAEDVSKISHLNLSVVNQLILGK